MFGSNWTTSFDPLRVIKSPAACIPSEIGCVPASASVIYPDGATYKYTPEWSDPGSYTVKGSVELGTLYCTSTTAPCSLSLPDRSYSFSSGGYQLDMYDRYGTKQLAYTYSSVRVTRVTNAAGRFLNFTYVSGLVTQVTDPAGRAWTYSYSGGKLVRVTSPSGPGAASVITDYLHEDPNDGTLLTGVSINGVRYSTYAYYADKRVRESGLTGGEERDTFVYSVDASGTPTTKVTDARGLVTNYFFELAPNGSPRIFTVSREYNATCPYAAAQTFYDANGYVDYTIDWNGVVTDYSYDATGKLLSLTTAYGDPAAHTTEYMWSGIDLIKKTFKGSGGAPYAETVYDFYPWTAGAQRYRLWRVTEVDRRSGAPSRQTTFAYTFHAGGRLASRKATRLTPAGVEEDTEAFDSFGNLTSATNAVGHQVTYGAYDLNGFAGRVTDAAGIATDFTRDPKGNALTVTRILPSGNQVTSLAYSGDLLTSVTTPTGAISRFQYNAARRLIGAGNALNEYVNFDVDIAANTRRVRSTRHYPVLSGSTPVASWGGRVFCYHRARPLGPAACAVGQ